MKITHFINLPSLGGIERLFLAFIESSLDDVEHSVLTAGDVDVSVADKMKLFNGKVLNFKRWGNVRIPGWPESLRDFCLRLHLSHSTAPDVLLMWSQLNSRGVAKEYKRLGSKVFYYEHGSAWLCNPSEDRKSFLDEVDGIICASYACARMLVLRWQVPEEKISVLTNPLLPALLPKEKPEQKLRSSNEPLRLGVAGRLVPLKGHGIAIGAVKVLLEREIECELHLAGSGPLEKELKVLAKELGVEKKVIFHGFVENMGEFFKSIDIFLCPSLREPFGLVSIEASAWGCPVVVANVDGLPETLIDGETGCLVSPTRDPATVREVVGRGWPEYVYDPKGDKVVATSAIDPGDLADVILQMAGNPQKLSDMGIKAAQFAIDKFSYSNYLRNLSSILDK